MRLQISEKQKELEVLELKFLQETDPQKKEEIVKEYQEKLKLVDENTYIYETLRNDHNEQVEKLVNIAGDLMQLAENTPEM